MEWLHVHHPHSLVGDFSSIDPSLKDEFVDSLMFETSMGYGGDIFPSLGMMLDHSDMGETKSATSTVPESSGSICHYQHT